MSDVQDTTRFEVVFDGERSEINAKIMCARIEELLRREYNNTVTVRKQLSIEEVEDLTHETVEHYEPSQQGGLTIHMPGDEPDILVTDQTEYLPSAVLDPPILHNVVKARVSSLLYMLEVRQDETSTLSPALNPRYGVRRPARRRYQDEVAN